MQLPITDKFLLDVHTVYQSTKKVRIIFNTPWKLFYQLQKHKNLSAYEEREQRKRFNRFLYYLKQKGYIKVENLKDKKAIMLTKKGTLKAMEASFFSNKPLKRRDGKWIMLMFDIPQAHKKARILMRSVLYNLEYKMLQQSVWVCPYDISKKTEKLLQFHSLDSYVKIFLIEKM